MHYLLSVKSNICTPVVKIAVNFYLQIQFTAYNAHTSGNGTLNILPDFEHLLFNNLESQKAGICPAEMETIEQAV